MVTYFIWGFDYNFTYYDFLKPLNSNKTTVEFHPSGKIMLKQSRFSSESIVGEITVNPHINIVEMQQR